MMGSRPQHPFVMALIAGIEPSALAIDDDGRVLLSMSPGLVLGIDYLEQANTFLLFADLGFLPPPGEDADEILKSLLEENLGSAPAYGAAFALDVETGVVAVFAQRSAAAMTEASFEDWVGDVAELAESWPSRLVQEDETTEAAA
jgi:hypothetical protein